MNIDILNNQNVVSFGINKINVLNSKEIETTLVSLKSDSKSKLTLNLSNVRFIDSTGFEMFKKLKSIFYINFINISDEMQELFTLVGF